MFSVILNMQHTSAFAFVPFAFSTTRILRARTQCSTIYFPPLCIRPACSRTPTLTPAIVRPHPCRFGSYLVHIFRPRITFATSSTVFWYMRFRSRFDTYPCLVWPPYYHSLPSYTDPASLIHFDSFRLRHPDLASLIEATRSTCFDS